MTLSELTWMLTGLAAVEVMLTRIRLASSDHRPAGHFDFARSVLNTHTWSGVLALGLWIPGLILGMMPLVYAGLGAWWLVTVAGLLLLARWLPSHGRHAVDAISDGWSKGPWLSMLAHLGMLGGALYFTWLVFIRGL